MTKSPPRTMAQHLTDNQGHKRDLAGELSKIYTKDQVIPNDLQEFLDLLESGSQNFSEKCFCEAIKQFSYLTRPSLEGDGGANWSGMWYEYIFWGEWDRRNPDIPITFDERYLLKQVPPPWTRDDDDLVYYGEKLSEGLRLLMMRLAVFDCGIYANVAFLTTLLSILGAKVFNNVFPCVGGKYRIQAAWPNCGTVTPSVLDRFFSREKPMGNMLIQYVTVWNLSISVILHPGKLPRLENTIRVGGEFIYFPENNYEQGVVSYNELRDLMWKSFNADTCYADQKWLKYFQSSPDTDCKFFDYECQTHKQILEIYKEFKPRKLSKEDWERYALRADEIFYFDSEAFLRYLKGKCTNYEVRRGSLWFTRMRKAFRT